VPASVNKTGSKKEFENMSGQPPKKEESKTIDKDEDTLVQKSKAEKAHSSQEVDASRGNEICYL
jgi:hypothetical protein